MGVGISAIAGATGATPAAATMPGMTMGGGPAQSPVQAHMPPDWAPAWGRRGGKPTQNGGAAPTAQAPGKPATQAAPMAGPGGAIAGANGGAAQTGAVGGAAQISGLDGIIAQLQSLIAELTSLLAQLGSSPVSAGGVGGASAQTPVQAAAQVPKDHSMDMGCGSGGCGGGGAAAAPAPIAPAVGGLSGGAAQPVEAPAPVVASRPVSSSNGEDGTFEAEVLARINAIRAQYGLSALTYDSRLDTASESHNSVMINARTMAHKDLGDGLPSDRVRAAGFTGSWGENVAVGQKTAEQVVNEWMASPTHRANILNSNFTLSGIAYGVTSDGVAFWTNTFGG